jgi:hypothetical protein
MLLPEIALDSETGVYTARVGRPLTVAPTVKNADGARFSWTEEGVPISSTPTLTHTWETPGNRYIDFTVENRHGKATEQIRVEVASLAPPVISLALPAGGLRVVRGTDHRLAPDIKNSAIEGFECEWLRGGAVVARGAEYTFNEAQTGTYTIVCRARNADGEDSREITIEVVDGLPRAVRFLPQSHTRTSTDRKVFTGTPIVLEPWIDNFEEPAFAWSVDGAPVEGEAGSMLRYTPTTAGNHTVTVAVSDTVDGARIEVSATVKVVCADATPDARYRPADGSSSAQWNKVWEYTPAPGQFIGETETGGFDGSETTPEAAARYAERRMRQGGWVSLGAFGGYMVVGFDHSIAKRAGTTGSAGDFDFSIGGSAFDNSSEPGIVWVMQDVDGNGEPDDEWYELKGSDTGREGTLRRYAVTYYKPAGGAMAVQWTDSAGGSGSIDHLPEFHRQEHYYPAWVADDTFTLYGTRLAPANTQDPVTGHWHNQTYDWGYADNASDIDTLGGGSEDGGGHANGFCIANAIMADGTPAGLQYIDFIKVQTGLQIKNGWLGEASTEVFSFTDLSIAER